MLWKRWSSFTICPSTDSLGKLVALYWKYFPLLRLFWWSVLFQFEILMFDTCYQNYFGYLSNEGLLENSSWILQRHILYILNISLYSLNTFKLVTFQPPDCTCVQIWTANVKHCQMRSVNSLYRNSDFEIIYLISESIWR